MLPGWRDCDPGAIDVMEVGGGTPGDVLQALSGVQYVVPYRVEFASNIADLCPQLPRPLAPRRGVAVLEAECDGPSCWRIQLLLGPNGNGSRLPGGWPRVPSAGGRPIAASSGLPWVIAVGAGLLLCGLVAVLMRAMPRPAPLSSEPIDPEEARGL